MPGIGIYKTTDYRHVTFNFANGGSALATGLSNTSTAFYTPMALVAVYLASPDNTSGSATIDVIVNNAAVPTSSTSMVGSGIKPVMTSAKYAKITSFPSWTKTAVDADDIVELNLTSVSSLLYLSVTLVFVSYDAWNHPYA